MGQARHVLVNALSVGGGGGVTVARELSNHLAMQRPDWQITVALNPQNPMHQELERGLKAPGVTSFKCEGSGGQFARARYERGPLVKWSLQNHVSAILQLNGTVIPGMPIPTLAHCQNPFPYQPIAWDGWRDRALSALKRRAQARSLPMAACVGWTSAYLRDLICSRLSLKPRCDFVFYNGVPDEWLAGSDANRPGLASRPLEILTLSNVAAYKRQALVIRALALLVKRAGLESLVYRIVGEVAPAYRKELAELARSLGVGDRVIIEGRIDGALVAQRYQQARGFVLMSVCESFGIPAVEAMSFGTPVIVANICALPEVCGNAADLVEPDQTTALADAIQRVLTDPEHADELRRARL